MIQLTSKKLYPVAPPPSPTPVDFVKPLSYEFRVAETVDDTGKIIKVSLQVQVWEHDEFGSGVVKHYWSDVPRQKFDTNGTLIIT
jgi:hypothetical protein